MGDGERKSPELDGDADTRMEGATTISGGGADEGRRDRSIYLVACHSHWVSKPYIVYKMDVVASSPSPVIPQRLKRFTRLKCDGYGKTFVSVRPTDRASWIIGVGGAPGDTVIFDTETLKVISGPPACSVGWWLMAGAGLF
jgi:hypothetical protein